MILNALTNALKVVTIGICVKELAHTNLNRRRINAR
jgi:hypothetical protein